MHLFYIFHSFIEIAVTTPTIVSEPIRSNTLNASKQTIVLFSVLDLLFFILIAVKLG